MSEDVTQESGHLWETAGPKEPTVPLSQTPPLGEVQAGDSSRVDVFRGRLTSGGPARFARGLRMVRLERIEEPYRMTEIDREAYRRRFAMLFVDDSTARHGGLGTVIRATNALGETVALKSLRVPERGELEDDASYAARLALTGAAFRAEYDSHRSVSGFKGFPRLYGFAYMGDVPCIVMEWVEGVTLSVAARMLSVDEAGRMAPLVAARLGRDLFDVLIRLKLVGEGFVHRDISPSNILVRTSHLSVVEQAAEGSFDLCLIDFGSSVPLDPMGDPGYTMRYATLRRATPDYAPPEMLTDDVRNLAELRKSEAIDVYAASSVVFELLGGVPPFALMGRAGESPYRIKMDEAPRPLVTAHHGAFYMGDVLMFEPEVEMAAQDAMLDMADPHDASEFRRALDTVDEQLADLLAKGLAPIQSRRASAEQLHDALAAFCERYAQNVVRALHGKRLLPCTGDVARRDGPSASTVNRMIGVIGFALSGAALVTVTVVTGLLLDGVTVTFRLDGLQAHGDVSGVMVSAALALPAVCGYVARGRAGGTRVGFVRSTAALGTAVLGLLALSSGLTFSGVNAQSPLLSALFLAAAAGWCPLVLEYATTAIPGVVDAIRGALPMGGGDGPLNVRLSRGRAHELSDGMEVSDVVDARK